MFLGLGIDTYVYVHPLMFFPFINITEVFKISSLASILNVLIYSTHFSHAELNTPPPKKKKKERKKFRVFRRWVCKWEGGS